MPMKKHLDLSGRKVGPYFLNTIMGFGSAGYVYHAVNTESKNSRLFAIKCLSKRNLSYNRMCLLAAEIINHDIVTGCPHVLPLYDIIEEDAYFFLVLSMCDTDMFRAIWDTQVYWKNDALIKKAFIEVIDGIFACHQKGIFHRDLKPENLMCRADGTGVLIGDFGLATNSRVCQDGGCGSPYYMSPECWTCDIGDPYFGGPTDVWSLGVILFNMVTSCYPWEAALPSDKKYRAFIQDENYLLHTSPISEPLNELLKRILHPTPTKRLSTLRIRRAVLEMNTFYRWYRPETNRVVMDPERTRVRPRDVPKEKKKTMAPSAVQKLIPWTKLHHRDTAYP